MANPKESTRPFNFSVHLRGWFSNIKSAYIHQIIHLSVHRAGRWKKRLLRANVNLSAPSMSSHSFSSAQSHHRTVYLQVLVLCADKMICLISIEPSHCKKTYPASHISAPLSSDKLSFDSFQGPSSRFCRKINQLVNDHFVCAILIFLRSVWLTWAPRSSECFVNAFALFLPSLQATGVCMYVLLEIPLSLAPGIVVSMSNKCLLSWWEPHRQPQLLTLQVLLKIKKYNEINLSGHDETNYDDISHRAESHHVGTKTWSRT